MDIENKQRTSERAKKQLGIIFRYSRANIYSYNALIGALEINSNLNHIPIFISRPNDFSREINQLFENNKYETLIIGFSINSFQIAEYQKLLRELNNHFNRQRMIIVVGGPHPSAKPKNLLQHGANFIVIGEGEKTFSNLVEAIYYNKETEKLKGIAYLNEEKELVITEKNDPIDLNDYPPFAPDKGLYSALEITRGCNFNCNYCQVPTLLGKPVRYRSPENIIKWGKFLLSQRESWDFRFISPNAFGYYSKKSSEPNLAKIKELLSGLKELKAKKRRRIFFGTFPSEVRPESITEGTLTLTKEYCHNRNITIGAQSGSPKILKSIQRGHTIEQVLEAVDLAKKYAFQTNIDFIMGFPEETTEDQFLTLEVCKDLIKMNCKIHMHYLIPLPGTKYEKKKPVPIDSEILKTLRRWTNEGIIFGSWEHQFNIVTERLKGN